MESSLIAMDTELYKELHEAVQNGDVEFVRRVLENHAGEQYFSYEETSALCKAYTCKKDEIAAHLIARGAKTHNFEKYDLYRLEVDLTRINNYLRHQNKKMEKSCIQRLLYLSQSPQGLNEERLSAVQTMYEDFFKSDIIRLLMMVLESEVFDIVYDFSSEDVNRIYRLNEEESEIFGLTLSNSKEIFIGARNLLSGDSRKKAKVHGVVAEELCHLAMTAVFKNNAKPYEEGDSKLMEDFWNIVIAVKSLRGRTCHVESVIQEVFEYYNYRAWECELIARVPNVIGIHGTESGRRILMESSELSNLLSFYEQNVLSKCKVYADPLLDTKSHREMKKLLGMNEFISFKEKRIHPLKEVFPSFREYIVVKEGISLITTNCLKLCTLHVYHELKPVYGDLLEKKCLFFRRKCFQEKKDEILNTMKCKVFEYLILILDDKELSRQQLTYECLDHFEEFIPEMKIVIISNSHFLGPEFQKKFVEYKWDDLTDEYKDFRTWPAEYIFKGERQYIFLKKEDVLEVFSEDDILRLISGDVMEVCDGVELDSKGYISETYVDRLFQAATVDTKVFDNLINNYNIFISGLRKSNFQELSINEKQVQWLEGSDDSIQVGKSIFILNDERTMRFGDFLVKTQSKTNICLYHDKNFFYLRNSDSLDKSFYDYKKQVTITEEGMIDLLKRNKILIISENAGHGKSTVLTSLIRNVSKNIYGSWVLRIDLKKFAMNQEEIFMTNIKAGDKEKDALDDVFLILGLSHGLEKCHFKEFSRYSSCCFLFFDGYDEIPQKYRTKALTLISFLREKTAVNIVITTRKLHQLELEETLNTYSHKLVPFDKLVQVSYFEKLWKWKLKFPNRDGALTSQKAMKAISRKIKSIIEEFKKEQLGKEYLDLTDALKIIEIEKDLVLARSKIDKLEFKELARLIIKKTSLDEETIDLMGIPLHLYTIGIIYYDCNFSLDIHYDIYSFYSSFIEQKIRVYMEEKLRIFPDGSYVKDHLMEVIRKDAFRIHSELADQLMDKGEVCMAVEGFEGELCTSLGIVFIYGGRFNFLHQTFAEFFKAESLRKNMQKEDFVKMLFEDKYNVVRRFLSCALERRNFENLTKEFFEDVDFLVTTMVKIADVYTDTLPYQSDSYMQSFSRIVRRVLEKFESVVVPNLVNQFLEKVEIRLNELVQQDAGVRRNMGKEEMVFDNYMILSNIGGCLTVKMLKYLLRRDIWINSNMVLNFVRFSENPDEVIDVLRECILIESEGEIARGLRERENGGKGKEDFEAEALLDVLWMINIESECGLFSYALSNDRAEMYVHLLKFFRDVLEKERFVQEIVRCDSYKELMNKFISEEHPRRICREFKGLLSVFGNEMKILFDNDCKFWVIDRAVEVDGKHEGSNSFENALVLFKECFGMDKLEEILLSKDSDGYYLIHVLMRRYSSTNFPANLNLIEDILHNHDKMKQFLKFSDRNFRNMFHVAALKGNVSFDELHEICDGRLSRDDIKEMLIATDLHGNNVMHSLFEEDSEKLTSNLNFIWNILGNDERFEEFIKNKGLRSRNIFHFSALKKDVNLDEVLRFCNGKLGKDEIKEMIISEDEYGDNVIHILVRKNASEILVKNLRIIKECLMDEEWFKQAIKSECRYFTHVFHYNAERDMHLLDLLQFCDAHFEKDDIREMLLSADLYGNNVMHSLLKNNSFERLVKNWNFIKEVFGNEGCFKQLLKSKGEFSMNMFHLAALQKDGYFNYALQYCDAHLDKDDIKGMLQSTTTYGDSVIKFLFRNNSSETLMKSLDLIKEIACDNEWFKQLLQKRNGDFKSVFHIAAQNKMGINPSFLDSYIPESEIPELLMERDKDGHTCLHAAASDLSNLLVYLDYAKEVLKRDKSRIEELLLTKDNGENTFLHLLDNWCFNSDAIGALKSIFNSLRNILSGKVYMELLRDRNEEERTFLQKFQRRNSIRGEVRKCFEEILGRVLFEELLQRKCYYTY